MPRKKKEGKLDRIARIDVLVLAYLRIFGVDVVTGESFSWIARKRIFKIVKISEDVGQRSLERLLRQGLIEKEKVPRGTSARYRYVLPPIYAKKERAAS